MTLGASVRQKALAAAQQWRKLRFRSLRRQLMTPFTGEIRLPLFSSEKRTPEPLFTFQLETNCKELIPWLQLEYFGFFHATQTKTTAETLPTASSSFSSSPTVPSLGCTEVCVHVGPPKSIGYPYALTSETENFTTSVRHSEAHSAWEETDPAGPHPVRWLTQPLLDGFVARRVEAHVGLAAGGMPQMVRMARKLNIPLAPHDASPFYFANELLSSWGVFGAEARDMMGDSHNHIRAVMELAHASAVFPLHRSAWLNGAAICNKNGDAILILGSRRSGKTTLALHCAAASKNIQLIGVENFHVATGAAVGPEMDYLSSKSYQTVLMGIPTSVGVGIGALIGTLRPNPNLVESAHNFDCTPEIIKQLLRNSELALWNMNACYQIHIGEAFGPQRWCPNFLGRIKGIVLLNWDLQELSLPHTRVKSEVVQWKSEKDISRLLNILAEERRGSLFKGHYLVRSAYDESMAWQHLQAALFSCEKENRPSVYEIQGSVSFDMAVKLICQTLLNKPMSPSH